MHFLQQGIQRFRHSLASIDALPQLTFIGIVVGVIVGGLTILFRLAVEYSLEQLLLDGSRDFEDLPRLFYFVLPVTGALIIAIAFRYIDSRYQQVSVGNVMERLHNFQGRMSAGNFLVQFFGGITCLISGQSVGREGPAVHIGASAASLLGQWLKLPNNSLRTLVGCGVAAAIAASFDTPVAGVIFAMEVVLMSYSITGFIPIMMASVCGAIVSRLVFEKGSLFHASGLYLNSMWELIIMVAAGFAIGLLAITYMKLQLGLKAATQQYSSQYKIIAAGIVTGSIGLFVPDILGLGYDTVNMALDGQLPIKLLIIILLAKLAATAFSIAMGMPGGLIGPQLFMGACIGCIVGHIVSAEFPQYASHIGVYVLLGMAAMMGAVINAPLAALMAILELTYNPSLMLPSLLIIVVSCVTTRQLSGYESIFVEQLKANGKPLNSSPAQQILNNVGVRSAMSTAFIESQAVISIGLGKHYLLNNPLWVVVHLDDKETLLLRASDLATYVAQHTESNHLANNHLASNQHQKIDLMEIPGQRFSLITINDRATLYEAQQQLSNAQSDALLVVHQPKNSTINDIVGVITHTTIESYYRL